jgi:hypothetical protein
MELLSSDPFNHRGYPRQRPQVRAEAMLTSALTQGRVHLPPLAGAEPRLAPRPARRSQTRHTFRCPLPVPAADTLSTGLQLAGYRALRLSLGEQTCRLLASVRQTGEIP